MAITYRLHKTIPIPDVEKPQFFNELLGLDIRAGVFPVSAVARGAMAGRDGDQALVGGGRPVALAPRPSPARPQTVDLYLAARDGTTLGSHVVATAKYPIAFVLISH
jgi:hypothetical protein